MENSNTNHNVLILKAGNNFIQFDRLTTRISLRALADKVVELLDYWCVSEFDSAYIDWSNYELVLAYETEHYVDRDYALEMLNDPNTVNLNDLFMGDKD